MKKTLTAFVAALAVLAAQAPAHAGNNGRNNVAKGFAVGLGVGIVAAAIASRSSVAATPSYAYSSYGYRGYDRCAELRFECRAGNGHACYKFDTRCLRGFEQLT